MYDITPLDSVYLSYHIQSGNFIEDLTDIDIKEILCPLDMNNFQKNLTAQTLFQKTYQQHLKNNTQYKPQYKTQTANFLGKTYQKKYDNPLPRPQQNRP